MFDIRNPMYEKNVRWLLPEQCDVYSTNDLNPSHLTSF